MITQKNVRFSPLGAHAVFFAGKILDRIGVKSRLFKSQHEFKKLIHFLPILRQYGIESFPAQEYSRITKYGNRIKIDPKSFAQYEQECLRQTKKEKPNYFTAPIVAFFKLLFPSEFYYFRQKGDILLEFSCSNSEKKFGVIINFRIKTLTVLYKKEKEIFKSSSIYEFVYNLGRWGMTEFYGWNIVFKKRPTNENNPNS